MALNKVSQFEPFVTKVTLMASISSLLNMCPSVFGYIEFNDDFGTHHAFNSLVVNYFISFTMNFSTVFGPLNTTGENGFTEETFELDYNGVSPL